jgi:hypothetical protein
MIETKESQPVKISPLRKWRSLLSKVAAIFIFGFILWWGWQNWEMLVQVFVDLGVLRLVGMVILLNFSILLSVLTFTILIRGMGYSFSFIDGYHSLNLAQVAAAVPGKVWGFAGLAGLLWARSINKRDSVLIITLNMLMMLSACVVVGILGLVPVIGWGLTILCLVPMLVIVIGRPWLDQLRERFFAGSSPLPSSIDLLKILLAGILSWVLVSITFAWLVFATAGRWPTSPFLVASALPAGYIGGFISLIAPSGLGVSEGIVTLILAPSMGSDRALSVAVAFRIIQTAVLWANVAVSLVMLSSTTVTARK